MINSYCLVVYTFLNWMNEFIKVFNDNGICFLSFKEEFSVEW